MAYRYAIPGPPFNFLGHFSESQRDSLKAWVGARAATLPDVATHNRMRAQQLRKTAGLLEKYYSSENDQPLTPFHFDANGKLTAWKDTWQPGPFGHFNYAVGNDHLPMVTVNKLKTRMKEQFERDDEGVFFMNHVRYMIERHEDEAQLAVDATDDTLNDSISKLLAAIDSYFAQPQYEPVLVKDKSDLYKGEPRYRVNQFDEPTRFELEQMTHSSTASPILLKEQDFAQ